MKCCLFFFIAFWFTAKGFTQEPNPTVLQGNEDPAPKLKKFIFARLETDKKRVYVNEPLQVTYKLYSALESSSFLMEEPKFNQFSAYNIKVKDSPVSIVINQVTFNVYEIKKLLLYSVSPGIFTLDKMKIKNDVLLKKQVPQKEINDAAGMLQHPENYIDQYTVLQTSSVAETDPVQIEVLPLPQSRFGKTDAVGEFEITGFAENKQVAVNIPIVLQYRISGTGNFRMIDELQIPFPAGAEVLEPKIINSFDHTDADRKGFKLFIYSILFKDTGTYKIPGLRFTFFNPGTSAFKTIFSDSIAVQVVPALAKIQSSGTSFINDRNDSPNKKIFFGAIGLAGLGFLMFFWLRKKNHYKKGHQSVLAETTEMEPDHFINTKTNIALHNNNEALRCLRVELLHAIAGKNNLPQHLGYGQMLEIIPGKKEYKESVLQIIQEIDNAIYAADNMELTAAALLSRAIPLIG
jgi:hypothetical protein